MKKEVQKLDVFKLYQKLYKLYGPQHWWPLLVKSQKSIKSVKTKNSDDLFEIACGAILTQNTSWKNVEKALGCLHQNNLLSAKAVAVCPIPKLQKCLRSSGYYKQKAKKLKIFSQWLVKNYQGSLKKFFKKSVERGREELLSLWGVGPETADSILLYAGNKPIFVVDAYTKRLCAKFGIKFKTYDEYRMFFEKNLPPSAKLFNEFHALIVASGKDKHGCLA